MSNRRSSLNSRRQQIQIKFPSVRQLSKTFISFQIPTAWLRKSGIKSLQTSEELESAGSGPIKSISSSVSKPYSAKDSTSIRKRVRVTKLGSQKQRISRENRSKNGKDPVSRKGNTGRVPYDGPKYKYIEKNVYVKVPAPSVNSDEDLPHCDCLSIRKDCSDEECINRVLMVCCPPSCPAAPNCKNMFPTKDGPIEPFKTADRGWGLRAKKPIAANQYITEYRGEIINSAECERRGRVNLQKGIWDTYLLGLESDLYIDARHMSGLGRFLNHSCEPNTIAQKWQDGPHPRIAVFAKRNIKKGEEITLDYSFSDPRNQFRHPCLCRSKNCRGYIDSDKPIDWEAEKKRQALSYNYCFECGESGDLLKCGFSHRDFHCYRAFHAQCIGLNQRPPEGTWFMCPSHTCDVCKKVPPQVQCLSCVSTWCQRHSPFPVDSTKNDVAKPQSNQSQIIYRLCPRCVNDGSHSHVSSSICLPLLKDLPQSRMADSVPSSASGGCPPISRHLLDQITVVDTDEDVDVVAGSFLGTLLRSYAGTAHAGVVMRPLSATFKRLHQALHCQQKALAALRLTPLRILLNNVQLNSLSSKANGVYLEPGQTLFNHGDEGDYVAVISKGLMKYDNCPFERTAGDFIYDLDDQGRRTRKIFASTSVRLFIWKLSDLDKKQLSDIMPLVLQSSIEKSLTKSTLFVGLSSNQIDLLCDMVHWRGADVNEIVIKEGNQGQSLFIVDQGLLRCYTGSATELENQIILGNIAPGDYIGEIALLIGIPRTASAVAVKPTSLIEIRATDFAHLVQLNAQIGEQIRNRIHIRLIMQFRRYRCPFFESLTDEQVHDLGPRSNLTFVPAETVLFRVGDPGDLFYMIAFGQVQLQLYNNDMTISTETILSAGSYFGELALRHDTPRYASAKTLIPSLFLTLSRAQFSHLFKTEQMPTFTALPSSVDDLIIVWRLMQTETGRQAITLFGQSRIAPDMMAFWLECESFRKSSTNMNHDELVLSAKKIVQTYLSENGVKNVGLPRIVRENLLEHVDQKEQDIDDHLFNMARFAIARIITSEVFPYLKRSDFYKQCLSMDLTASPRSSGRYDPGRLGQVPRTFNLESMSSTVTMGSE